MRKSFYYTTCLFLAFSSLFGTRTKAQLNLFWEEIGPNNVGNHCRAIAAASGKLWAGSVGGGLWTSTNGGASWTQITGVDNNLAVSSIAVEGNNIYVGTGETFFYEPSTGLFTGWTYDKITTVKNAFHQYAGMPGQGVFVSNDGGATWNHNNGTWGPSSTPYDDDFMSIQKVNVKGGRAMVATLKGLYWSDNADLSTVTKANGSTAFMNSPIVDVEFSGSGIVLAATKDSLYRSTDNGANFGSPINTSIPLDADPTSFCRFLGGDRIEVAVAPSNPDILYVTGASGINGNSTGVFKSTDAGISWTRITPCESGSFAPFKNNGVYSMFLSVFPDDPNSFLVGGANMYIYTEADGLLEAAEHVYLPGFIDNYVPKTQHAVVFDPNNNNIYYVVSDHEIVKTIDRGETFNFCTKNFNNSHLYAVSASADWKVLASDRYEGLLWKNNGNTGQQEFAKIYSAAKGIGRYSIANSSNIITSGPDGGVIRSLTDGNTYETFYGFPKADSSHTNLGADSLIVDRPDTETQGGNLYDNGVAAVNPWVLDEYIPTGNLGSDSLVQSTPAFAYLASRHFVWVCSNPFGTLDSLPAWNRLTLNLVNGGASPKEFITALAISGDDTHTLWIGTNYGKIFRIQNANDPWNVDPLTDVVRVDTGNGLPTRWITNFAVDPTNNNNVVVCYGGYENGEVSYVWISNNAMAAAGTVSFSPIGNNLAEVVPVYCAAFHPDPAHKSLMIGTDVGFFSTTSDYESGSAVVWDGSTGVGRVPVYDIHIRKYYMVMIDAEHWKLAPNNTIFIATHGRGAFKSNSTVSIPEADLNENGIQFGLYPNPVNDIATVEFSLNGATNVELSVYSLDGRKVSNLANGQYPYGTFQSQFNTSGLAPGMYLVRGEFNTSSGTYTKTIKTAVIR